LKSATGSIIQQNSAIAPQSELIVANHIVADANNGIRMLWTAVDTVDLTNRSQSGDIRFHTQASGLINGNLDIVAAHQTHASGNGRIQISTDSGDITVLAAAQSGRGISVAGQGELQLVTGTMANQQGQNPGSAVYKRDEGANTIVVNHEIATQTGRQLLLSNGSVSLNAPLTSTLGTIEVVSRNANVALNNLITSQGGRVSISADTSVVMASDAEISTFNNQNNIGEVVMSAGDDIVISQITADGLVSLTANAGTIRVASGTVSSALNIKDLKNAYADPTETETLSVILQAGQGVGAADRALQMRTANLALNAGSDVYISEATHLEIESFSVAGEAVLTLVGNLDVMGEVRVDNDLRITSTDGEIRIESDVVSTAGSIWLTAENAISLENATVSTLAADKTLELWAKSGAIAMNANSRVATNNGDMLLKAANDIEVATLEAGRGSVGLVSNAGELNVQAVDGVNVSADGLLIDVVGTAGTDAAVLKTDVNKLAVKAASLAVSDASDLSVGSVSVLTLDTLSGVAVTGAVVMTTLGNLTLVENQAGLVATGAGDIELTVGGNLTLNALMNADAGQLTLSVAGGVTQSANMMADGLVSIKAGAFAMLTSSEIVSAVNKVEMELASLTMTAANRIDANTNIKIVSGAAEIGQLIADNSVTIEAASLSNAGDTTTLNAETANLVLVVTGAVGASDKSFNTDVVSLDVTAGALFLNEKDALNVVKIAVTNGDVGVTTGGNLILIAGQPGLVATGAGYVTLDVTGDLAVNAAINAGSGKLAIKASGAMSQSANIVTTDAIEIGAASLSMNAANHIQAGTSIALDLTGAANVSQLIATDLIDITAVNVVNAGDSTTLNAKAANLVLNVTGAVAASNKSFNTDVVSLDATAGALFLNEKDALNVNRVAVTNGDVEITTGGDLTLVSEQPGLVATGAGNVTLDVTGDLAVNALINAGSGQLVIDATRAINQTANIVTTGAIEIGAASLSMNAENHIQAGTSIALELTGAANVGQLIANNLIDIKAASLSNAGDTTTLNAKTANLVLNVTGAVGASDNAFNTDVVSLDVTAGALFLNEKDALNVNRVAVTNGDVEITAGGNLTLVTGQPGLVATGAGNVTLDVTGDLAVNAVINAGAGDLSITASGAITQSANVTTSVKAEVNALSMVIANGAKLEAKELTFNLTSLTQIGNHFAVVADKVTFNIAQTLGGASQSLSVDAGAVNLNLAAESNGQACGQAWLSLQAQSVNLSLDLANASAMINAKTLKINEVILSDSAVRIDATSINLVNADLTDSDMTLVATGAMQLTGEVFGRGDLVLHADSLTQAKEASIELDQGSIALQVTEQAQVNRIAAFAGLLAIEAKSITAVASAQNAETQLEAAQLSLNAETVGEANASLVVMAQTLATTSSVGSIYLTVRDDVEIGLIVGQTVRVVNGDNVTISHEGMDSADQLILVTDRGSIEVSAAISAQNDVTLAANGAFMELNMNANITSATGAISLFAEDSMSLTAKVETQGKTIMMDAGFDFVMGASASIVSNHADINLTAENAMRLAMLNAGNGKVELTAGDAIVGVDATSLISANTLVIDAQGNVGSAGLALATAVESLGVANADNVFIAQTDDLILDNLNASGSVVIKLANGDLVLANVNETQPSLVGRHVLFMANNLRFDSALSASGSMSLLASERIDVNADVQSLMGTMNLSAGTLVMDAQASLSALGNMRLVMSGEMALSTVNSSGSVDLQASTIQITASGLISANQLRMQAESIGSEQQALLTNVVWLSAHSSLDSIYLQQDGRFIVGEVKAVAVNHVLDNGTLVSSSTGASLSGIRSAKDLMLSVSEGGLFSMQRGAIHAGAAIELRVAGQDSDVNLNSLVSSDTGDIQILTEGNLYQFSNVRAYAENQTVAVEADGDVSMSDTAQTLVNNGLIDYQVGGDLSLGLLSAGLAGQVEISAGSVTNSGAVGTTNILAESLVLNVSGAVGSVNKAIQTDVNTLEATATSLYLTDKGDLTVDSVDAQTDVVLRVEKDLFINEIEAGHSVTLHAKNLVNVAEAGSVNISTKDLIVDLSGTFGSLDDAMNVDVETLKLSAEAIFLDTESGFALDQLIAHQGDIVIMAKESIERLEGASGNLVAGLNVHITSEEGRIDLGDVSAGGNAVFNAEQSLVLGDTHVGGILNAQANSIALGAMTVIGKASLTANEDFALNGSSSFGDNVTLTATSATLKQAVSVAGSTDFNVDTLTAEDDFTGTGDITITAQNDVDFQAGLVAGSTLNITSEEGNVTLHSVDVFGNAMLEANQSITLGSVDVGGEALIKAGGVFTLTGEAEFNGLLDVTATSASLKQAVNVTGKADFNVDTLTAEANFTGMDAITITAENDVDFQAGLVAGSTLNITSEEGNITLNTVDVTGAAEIEAKVGNFTLNGEAEFKNLLNVTATAASLKQAVSAAGTTEFTVDSLTAESDFSGTGAITINAENDVDFQAGLVTGGTLNITSTNGNITLNTVDVTGAAEIEAKDGDFTLTGEGKFAGLLDVKATAATLKQAVSVAGKADFNVDTLTTEANFTGTGAITINAENDVAFQAVLVAGSTLNITSTNGNITLNTVDVTGAAEIEAKEGDFMLTAEGKFAGLLDVKATAVTLEKAVSVTGSTDFNVASLTAEDDYIGTGAITINAENNVDFQAGLVAGSTLNITSTNGNITLNTVDVTGTAEIEAKNGNFTLNGEAEFKDLLDIKATAATLKQAVSVAGKADFNVDTLTTEANFSGTGAITINAENDVDFQASLVAGSTLNITSEEGNVTLNTVEVTGAAEIEAKDGDFTLTGEGKFAGLLDVKATAATLEKAVSVTGSTDFNVASLTAEANFTGTGAITINAENDVNFQADLVAGATLTVNSATGAISLTATNVTGDAVLTAGQAMSAATTLVGGQLIAQARSMTLGATTVTGATALTAAESMVINGVSRFGDNLSLTAKDAKLNETVRVAKLSQFTLEGLEVAKEFTGTGAITITAENDVNFQAGLVAGSTLNITSTNGNITLNSVEVTGAAEIEVKDGNFTLNGEAEFKDLLDIKATAATLKQAASVAGKVDFNVDTLTAESDFTGTGAITINAENDVDFQAGLVAGSTLNITSTNGNITLNTVDVTGAAEIEAKNGNFTMNGVAEFKDLLDIKATAATLGKTVSVTGSTDFNVASLTAEANFTGTGAITITAENNVNFQASLMAGANLTVNSSTGAISLTTTNVTGDAVLTAGQAMSAATTVVGGQLIAQVHSMTLGATTVTGATALTAAENMVINGVSRFGDNLTLTAKDAKLNETVRVAKLSQFTLEGLEVAKDFTGIGDISINANKDVNFQAGLVAASALTINSETANISLNTVNATGKVEFTSAKDFSLNSIGEFNDSLNITATNVQLNNVLVSGLSSLVATQSISIGTIDSKGEVLLSAGGALNAGTINATKVSLSAQTAQLTTGLKANELSLNLGQGTSVLNTQVTSLDLVQTAGSQASIYNQADSLNLASMRASSSAQLALTQTGTLTTQSQQGRYEVLSLSSQGDMTINYVEADRMSLTSQTGQLIAAQPGQLQVKADYLVLNAKAHSLDSRIGQLETALANAKALKVDVSDLQLQQSNSAYTYAVESNQTPYLIQSTLRQLSLHVITTKALDVSQLTTNTLSLQRFEQLRNPVVVYVQESQSQNTVGSSLLSNLTGSQSGLDKASMSMAERAVEESLIQQVGSSLRGVGGDRQALTSSMTSFEQKTSGVISLSELEEGFEENILGSNLVNNGLEVTPAFNLSVHSNRMMALNSQSSIQLGATGWVMNNFSFDLYHIDDDIVL
jgi:hypothetical protein